MRTNKTRKKSKTKKCRVENNDKNTYTHNKTAIGYNRDYVVIKIRRRPAS